MEQRNIDGSNLSQHTLEQNIEIRIDNVSAFQPPQFIKKVKCSVSLQKDTLKLVKDTDENFYIYFKYDADLDSTVNFYFAAKDDSNVTLYILL